ncbi:MAG: 16S rRNA (cytosine(1402)-N(4))-methyltransferase RsmH [Bacteroidales bacterium]|nr:16S rRNA (cytosine(1402)-N(4))-methyltransferase RsmH [Bacteroidales bacterium]
MDQSNSDNYHVPVMLTEALDGLNIRPDGTYVDVTFGGGGHSRAIMERLGEGGRLLAFDQDADAAANAIDDSRFTLIGENFRHMKAFLRMHGVRQVDGVLADLGVSSHQFDTAGRGFSTRIDGELDMRMDSRQPESARDLVNSLDEEGLARLLKLYGELPNARQMARAIVKARSDKEITTTFELRDAVSHHLPRGMENKYLAMLFQALRIEVNGELEALKEMLLQATSMLGEGGRLVVISYHSLEDRLVKNYMKTGNFEGQLEKDFYGNVLAPLRMISRGAIQASEAELQCNNRSRSAKLRVAERIEN